MELRMEMTTDTRLAELRESQKGKKMVVMTVALKALKTADCLVEMRVGSMVPTMAYTKAGRTADLTAQ
jgi:aromatic ring-opening dioxygenase LigB subunit